jgi:hypothetical protein
MKCRSSCIGLLAVVVVSVSVFQAHAEIESWSASSGLRPDQASTNWTYRGESRSVRPTFYQDYMIISTTQNQRVSYFESAGCLDIPTNLTIEFRTRVWERNACYDTVSPTAVFLGLGGGLGSVLYLGRDDVWLSGGNNTRGAGTKSVDTDNTFHTYRIELAGLTLGSAINVFYDNSVNPLFTGSVIHDLALNGNDERIGFGDNTRDDSGVSKWDYLWHNAKCVPIDIVPEPTIATLLIAGGAMLLARRNHRKSQA